MGRCLCLCPPSVRGHHRGVSWVGCHARLAPMKTMPSMLLCAQLSGLLHASRCVLHRARMYACVHVCAVALGVQLLLDSPLLSAGTYEEPQKQHSEYADAHHPSALAAGAFWVYQTEWRAALAGLQDLAATSAPTRALSSFFCLPFVATHTRSKALAPCSTQVWRQRSALEDFDASLAGGLRCGCPLRAFQPGCAVLFFLWS